MMRMQFVMCRGHLLEFILDRQRRFTWRQTGSISDPEYMRVDGDGRLAKSNIQHDIRRLSADARQSFQRFAITRHIAVMMCD